MVTLMHSHSFNAFADQQKRRNMITCANCGCLGHVYRTCNHPTISYGFICFRIVEIDDGTYAPEYLMVQRKDSLSYVEFMRGKYDLENKTYIMRLLCNMTEDERKRLKTYPFDTLWKDMWCKGEEDGGKNFNKEYHEASEKFARIKKGYHIKSVDSLMLVNIDVLVDLTTSTHKETEWGFPKGRRNVNENDISCAIREFREETGMTLKNIEICHSMKPMEEIFSGSNKKRYKHVYYIAEYIGNYDQSKYQPSCREIKDVKWFTYDDAQAHIRDTNVERKELLKRLHHIITRDV